MNCSEVGARLGAFADDELPRSIRQEVEAHIADCPVCRREAERLTENLVFLKRTMGLLGSGGDLSGDFLDDLRPKTKAEVAAAEREVTGQPDSHRIRNLVVAVIVLVAAVVAYLIVFAPGDTDEEKSGNRATIKPSGDDPRTVRAPDSSPPERTVPRTTARPVKDRTPGRRNGGGTIESLPQDIARALRSRGTDRRIPGIIKKATAQLRSTENVEKVRKLVVSGRSPRMTGILLIILGSAPDPSSVRPILVTHLRAGSTDPAVRAGAAIALCRTAPRSHQVIYRDGIRIPVGAPSPDAVQALTLALTTESDPSVLGVEVSLLGPTARTNADLAVALVGLLPGATDEKAADRILTALSGARHAEMAPGLERWLSAGQAAGMALPKGLALLRTIDANRAAGIAVGLLEQGTIRDAAVRRGLVAALAGRRDEQVAGVLRGILDSDPDMNVRLTAVQTVNGLEHDRAMELLRVAANDRDEPVREAAKAALEALARKNEGGGDSPGDR